MKTSTKFAEIEVKEEKLLKRLSKNTAAQIVFVIVIFGLIIGLIIYLSLANSRIYIENAQILAPVITLSPLSGGILDNVYVKEGDHVSKDMTVASVNGIPIKAKTDGLVIFVQNTPGQIVSAQSIVVQMIDPRELRVVGHLEEDKGLNEVKLWQKVVFSVDAFSGKSYNAVVDSISPTARSSDIVFSISDKRQEQQFDVKAIFDVDSYPELKNGMSAKMWIYK